MILTDYYKASKVEGKKARFEIGPSTHSYEIFETSLLNPRNPNKGGYSLNFGNVPDNFNASAKRKADKCISRNGNISSIYIPNSTLPYGWGDIQNPKTKVISNDALIVVFNTDYTSIELFIARGYRSDARQIYQSLCDGLLDGEMNSLREKAT